MSAVSPPATVFVCLSALFACVPFCLTGLPFCLLFCLSVTLAVCSSVCQSQHARLTTIRPPATVFVCQLFVCLSVCYPLSLLVCLLLCLSVVLFFFFFFFCVCVCVCMCVCVCVCGLLPCLLVYLLTYLSACLSATQFVSVLSVCYSVSVFAKYSNCCSVCLSVSYSACLSATLLTYLSVCPASQCPCVRLITNLTTATLLATNKYSPQFLSVCETVHNLCTATNKVPSFFQSVKVKQSTTFARLLTKSPVSFSL